MTVEFHFGEEDEEWFGSDEEVEIPEPFNLMGLELPPKAEVVKGEHLSEHVLCLVKHRFSNAYAIYMSDGTSPQRSRMISNQREAEKEYDLIRAGLVGDSLPPVTEEPTERPAGWGRFA